MAFNIDADPANADWLRRSEWNIPAETLEELFVYLGVLDQPREAQVDVLSKFMKSSSYRPSPLLLKQQADEFINGFELGDLSKELKNDTE